MTVFTVFHRVVILLEYASLSIDSQHLSINRAQSVNPVCLELNREKVPYPPFTPGNMVSRDGSFCSASVHSFSIPRLNLICQCGAYARASLLAPAFRDGIHPYRQSSSGESRVLSGGVIAYRWCSPSRVRQLRAGNPQGSSGHGCCLFWKPRRGAIHVRTPLFSQLPKASDVVVGM